MVTRETPGLQVLPAELCQCRGCPFPGLLFPPGPPFCISLPVRSRGRSASPCSMTEAERDHCCFPGQVAFVFTKPLSSVLSFDT